MSQLTVDHITSGKDVSPEDRVLFSLAQLMEGGKEEEETCRYLDTLTKTFSKESENRPVENEGSKGEHVSTNSTSEGALHNLVDADCFDTIMGCLDLHRSPTIRGHATLTASAYLKDSGERGTKQMVTFFQDRVTKGTCEDLIVAFSVAASIFPIAPQMCSELFLMEGFIPSLGPLMNRKWTSKRLEQSALEMLNAACMNAQCREAIQKYCLDWLEEIVENEPRHPSDVGRPEMAAVVEDGPVQQQVHSEAVRNLAGVILAKLQAIPLTPTNTSNPSNSEEVPSEGRIQAASTSMEELSDMFTAMLSTPSSIDHQNSIEGLAYASLRSQVKEKLAFDRDFLKRLIKTLEASPAKSPSMYGGLTILVNLTSYQPVMTEEQKKMSQLKAYANAAKPNLKPDLLNNDDHVRDRCKAVFEAGVIPMLVTHSQHGSVASLNLVVTIVSSLARTSNIRGRIAQQGGVKLLLHAYNNFPEDNVPARRTTSHALARILISTNPAHVFGGSTPLPLNSAIRPLLLLLEDDTITEHRDLLPAFESLLALTNLASISDDARNPIIRLAWPRIENLLLENNELVSRATVELICNLVQSPEGVAKFADGSRSAKNSMHILLALTDSEDRATRMAAGGAVASLTEWDTAVSAILQRVGGVKNLLQLCVEDDEELRHRGVVCILNVVTAPQKIGDEGIEKVMQEHGVEKLKECLKKSRSQEVLGLCVEALKKILAKDAKTMKLKGLN